MQISVRSPNGILTTNVDDIDADLAAFRWNMAGGKGSEGKYAARRVSGRTEYMHRVIAARMGLIKSAKPESGQRGRWRDSIDHDNGDKLDNHRSNLKLRDRPQQMTNPNDGLRRTNTSGFRGVTRAPGRKRPWTAGITEAGRHITLGWFATAEEAAEARKSYEAAPDKAAWLAARRPRDTGASGVRGVMLSGGRYYACATKDGRTITLGGSASVEEALAVREAYLAALDKEAWLREHSGGPQSNGTSGYRGVSFLRQVKTRQWLAYANAGGKRFNLGRYDTAEEAAAARRAWDEEQGRS